MGGTLAAIEARLPAAPDPGVGLPGPARDRARATGSSSGVNRFQDDDEGVRPADPADRPGGGAAPGRGRAAGPGRARPGAPGRPPCDRLGDEARGDGQPAAADHRGRRAAYATVGEISDRLRAVVGRPPRADHGLTGGADRCPPSPGRRACPTHIRRLGKVHHVALIVPTSTTRSASGGTRSACRSSSSCPSRPTGSRSPSCRSASRRSSSSSRPTTRPASPGSSRARARASTTSASRSTNLAETLLRLELDGLELIDTRAAQGRRGTGRVPPPALVPRRARGADRGAGRAGLGEPRLPRAALSEPGRVRCAGREQEQREARRARCSYDGAPSASPTSTKPTVARRAPRSALAVEPVVMDALGVGVVEASRPPCRGPTSASRPPGRSSAEDRRAAPARVSARWWRTSSEIARSNGGASGGSSDAGRRRRPT